MKSEKEIRKELSLIEGLMFNYGEVDSDKKCPDLIGTINQQSIEDRRMDKALRIRDVLDWVLEETKKKKHNN